MPDYPPQQDGFHDPAEVKVESQRLPLIDQQLWNIELVEWMREVTEPYTDEQGQEISVRILVPQSEQLIKYKAYLKLRAESQPKHRIRGALLNVLKAFAFLDPYYVWTEMHREDAESGRTA